MQVFELSNCGAVSAPWRLDTASIEAINRANYDFEVVKVEPCEGCLDPQSSMFVHVYFTPIESKEIMLPLRVELLKGTFTFHHAEKFSRRVARRSFY